MTLSIQTTYVARSMRERDVHVGYFSFMRNNKCARLINVSLWGLNISDGELLGNG
jgi:hypothetical protein